MSEETIPDSTAYKKAEYRRSMSSEIIDRSDDDENGSRDWISPLPLHETPINDDSSEEDVSEDTDDGLTEHTPLSWLKVMIPDYDSSADLEAGTYSQASEFDDNDDNDANVSVDGPPSLPMRTPLISNDSAEEYESYKNESASTVQTHSSWIKKMIPNSAALEAGETRHNMCDLDDDRVDDENDSHNRPPSMASKQDASMDDDSLDRHKHENTEDEMACQAASIAALVTQTSQ